MQNVARVLVAPGKGILAADESLPTIEKRFKSIGVGQRDVEATERLNAMNKRSEGSRELSFSFGRALQAPALAAWKGRRKMSPLHRPRSFIVRVATALLGREVTPPNTRPIARPGTNDVRSCLSLFREFQKEVIDWQPLGSDEACSSRTCDVMKAEFANRREAGWRLASQLDQYVSRPDVIVLALPRGGVPVGFEVQWYEDFSQTTDQEVRELLEEADRNWVRVEV